MDRWYFWVLAPIFLATALGLPLIVDPPTTVGVVVLYLFSGTLLIATLGLVRPQRFQWALKFVAGTILFAYSAYAVAELIQWWNGKPFGWTAARSQTNLRNALTGLVVYGGPSLYFLFKGRSETAVDELLDVEEDH